LSPAREIKTLLVPYPRETPKLALQVRDLILQIVPKAIEMPDAAAKIIG
jgi:hypothetical protein